VFSPSVCVVLGLCMDLAQTQLGRGWLVKQNIHQNSVRVQSEHSPWTVHGLHGVRMESVRIRWGSVKTSMLTLMLQRFVLDLTSPNTIAFLACATRYSSRQNLLERRPLRVTPAPTQCSVSTAVLTTVLAAAPVLFGSTTMTPSGCIPNTLPRR
jgi:hypothetical protein